MSFVVPSNVVIDADLSELESQHIYAHIKTRLYFENKEVETAIFKVSLYSYLTFQEMKGIWEGQIEDGRSIKFNFNKLYAMEIIESNYEKVYEEYKKARKRASQS